MKISRKRILEAGLVIITFSLGFAPNVWAQSCAIAPTCESLGYTMSSTDCEGHNFLKCPFDTTVGYCDMGSSESSSKCEEPTVGGFLFSDMSCSTALSKDKTVIGVIFDAEYRLALALDEQTGPLTTTNFKEDPNIPYDHLHEQYDFSGKNKTKILMEACQTQNISCPGIEYVSSYKTAGTNAGDWYLPAYGELYEMLISVDPLLNKSLSMVGGKLITVETSYSAYDIGYFSSTIITFRTDYTTTTTLNVYRESNQIKTARSSAKMNGSEHIRPVIQF